MFDILIIFAVIYFVGSAIMKRVVVAQKKAGTPPQRSGRPTPSGAPPWMRPSTPSNTLSSGQTPPASAREQSASGSKRSVFESLYGAIRDQLDPSALDGEALPSPRGTAPENESVAMEQSLGSIKSYNTMEGYANAQDYNATEGYANAQDYKATEGYANTQDYKTTEGYADAQDYKATEGVSQSHRNPTLTRVDAGPAKPVTLTGLGLRLNADTLVQGVIFSEILNRKRRGMRR